MVTRLLKLLLLQGLTDVIAEAEGLVAVTCFASNVARLGSIMTAAAANNRSICVVGRALNRTIGAARDTGYLADIPDFVSESEASVSFPEITWLLSVLALRERQEQQWQKSLLELMNL